MDLNEIEYKIGQHEMTAEQVFTQMKQHIKSSNRTTIKEDLIIKITELICNVKVGKISEGDASGQVYALISRADL